MVYNPIMLGMRNGGKKKDAAMKMRQTIPQGTTYLRTFEYIVLGAIILYVGSPLWIPLSFALLVSFILYPFCSWLEKWGIKRTLAIVLGISGLGILFLGVMALLARQFFAFLKEWPGIRDSVMASMAQLGLELNEIFGLSVTEQEEWVMAFRDYASRELAGMVGNVLSVSVLSGVMLVMIPIFSALILFYRHLWIKVLYRLFPRERREDIGRLLTLTVKAYFNFIKGMALVYLIVGILNTVGLLALGVPHAFFFGMAVSILTFIPYIGIVVGSLLPMTMAWVTYNSIWYPIGVVAVFTVVQYLEANIIFPLAVSNRLKMNALVALMAIMAGGIFWGVAGMVLFVPYLAIIKLVADHHPGMKTLSIALGTGNSSSG